MSAVAQKPKKQKSCCFEFLSKTQAPRSVPPLEEYSKGTLSV